MDTKAAILERLRAASPVWISTAAELLPDQPRGDVAAALAELVAEGLVDDWPDSPDGPAIILSSLATSRMKLELFDDGGLQESRWVKRGKGPAPTSAGLPGPHGDSGRTKSGAESLWDLPLDHVIFEDSVPQALAEVGPVKWEHWRDADELLVTGESVPCWTRAHEPPRGGECLICGANGPSAVPARMRPTGQVVFRGTGSVCLGCLRSSIDSALPTPRPIREPAKKTAGGKKSKAKEVYELAATASASGRQLKGGLG